MIKDLSKEAVNELPLGRFEGKIHWIRTAKALKQTIETLAKAKVVGFDTESRPAFRKGEYYLPSIVQLATLKDAYVIQLKPAGGLNRLKKLMELESLRKVGVALHDDIKDLQDLSNFKPAGFYELHHITDKLGLKKTGLRSLAASLLEIRISKSAQASNWSHPQLTQKQLLYAATDAWASLAIYMKARNLLGKSDA